MNDLSKKEEMHIEESNPPLREAVTSNALLRKKLESFLLLLYQGYLKGETDIEPNTRAAFLSLVKQDKEFAFKVRMLQLDLLNLKDVELEGEWNEAAEELFPEVEAVDRPLEEERKKTLTKYKETILELLKSSSELSS